MAGEDEGSAAVAPAPAFKKRAAGGKNFRRRGKGGGFIARPDKCGLQTTIEGSFLCLVLRG